MVTRFGSREICDVTFKALTNGQRVGNKEFKAGQPVFVIDTATASNMEQASTTVYAQGGRGYNRLIAWEGEKTMTFTVTDALMSPLGLAVLTGAGFAKEDAVKHIHMTYDLALDSDGVAKIAIDDFARELGVSVNSTIRVCNDQPDADGHVLRPYATILDNNGAIIDWVDADNITLSGVEDASIENAIVVNTGNPLTVTVANCGGKTIKLDFYVYMTTGATEITIKPDDFGGNFYVEADTLYRNQDGKDMAATLTFPKVKIQSGFTLSMAPTGDPSTFDFVMDAMPGYTYFDRANKVVCDITIVSGASDEAVDTQHSVPVEHKKKVANDARRAPKGFDADSTANQNAIAVTRSGNDFVVSVAKPIVGATGADGLNAFTSTDPVQAALGDVEWIAILINTNDVLTNVTWNGTPLTQADIDEAQTMGATDDKTIVFWVPFEKLPKTVTLGSVDGSLEDSVLTFKKK